MSADVALDARLMRQLYPFCRLAEAANILVMPSLAQRQHHGQAAAASRRRNRRWTVADRSVPPGPDRQHRGHGVGPGQSRERWRRTTRSADRGGRRRDAGLDDPAPDRAAAPPPGACRLPSRRPASPCSRRWSGRAVLVPSRGADRRRRNRSCPPRSSIAPYAVAIAEAREASRGSRRRCPRPAGTAPGSARVAAQRQTGIAVGGAPAGAPLARARRPPPRRGRRPPKRSSPRFPTRSFCSTSERLIVRSNAQAAAFIGAANLARATLPPSCAIRQCWRRRMRCSAVRRLGSSNSPSRLRSSASCAPASPASTARHSTAPLRL